MLNDIERELNPINVYPPRIKVNTRISLKVDSIDNWLKSTIPLHVGEAAVSYVILGGRKQHYQIKIGDGEKVWKELDFIWIDPNKIDFSQLNKENVSKLEKKLEEYFIEKGIFNQLSSKVEYINKTYIPKDKLSAMVEQIVECDDKICEKVYSNVSSNIDHQISSDVTPDLIQKKVQILSAGCSKCFNFK